MTANTVFELFALAPLVRTIFLRLQNNANQIIVYRRPMKAWLGHRLWMGVGALLGWVPLAS